MDLTVADRILIHLAPYSRRRDDFVCPREVTQNGVSSAVGVSREHASLELRKLAKRGLIVSKTSHVKWLPRRIKVYFLTETGMAVASALLENGSDPGSEPTSRRISKRAAARSSTA